MVIQPKKFNGDTSNLVAWSSQYLVYFNCRRGFLDCDLAILSTSGLFITTYYELPPSDITHLLDLQSVVLDNNHPCVVPVKEALYVISYEKPLSGGSRFRRSAAIAAWCVEVGSFVDNYGLVNPDWINNCFEIPRPDSVML